MYSMDNSCTYWIGYRSSRPESFPFIYLAPYILERVNLY